MKLNTFIKSTLIGLTVAAAAPAAMAATQGQVGYLNSLYEIGLNRAADAGGMNFYINAINSQTCSQSQAASLAAAFFGSQELQDQHLSAVTQINRLYRAVLKRDPSANELLQWAAHPGATWDSQYTMVTFKAAPLADIARFFANSEEFKVNRLGTYCN
ncbi:DUF4214 domain-containing protein [Parachitinimonas caeni]|uniref:DUF4214 domain-containing protein n=1 Tax=Parachitinimonas caeni TaxID=3031301 RepID=A0ABT7E0K4_9NEIS|nr:DUF4214 domain-containing protein [Parachitinimonas caeni]MDK2125774.1 DUF4214 domain-containing protein [Parachitinimonas caeni]